VLKIIHIVQNVEELKGFNKMSRTIKEVLYLLANNSATLQFDMIKIVDSSTKEIKDILDSSKPDIKNHACRFNDGKCVCDCYKLGQDDYKSNIEKVIGYE